MIEMTSGTIGTELLAMLILGAIGQLARSIIGLYKLRLKDGANWKPDWMFLGISVASGGVVGIVAGVLLETTSASILIPLGYTGVDALEGLLDKRLADKKG